MKRQAILVIYDNGDMERADLPGGTLRSIGQQLIAIADNAMIPGNPQPEPEPEQNGTGLFTQVPEMVAEE